METVILLWAVFVVLALPILVITALLFRELMFREITRPKPTDDPEP